MVSNFQINNLDGLADETPNYTVEKVIANIQQKEDPSARYYAAWWIGRFRVTETIAIDALVEALQDESDRSPDSTRLLARPAPEPAPIPGNSSCWS
ncbi:MAG: hypothetical protein ACKO2V_03225, partial [Snowella sp.]